MKVFVTKPVFSEYSFWESNYASEFAAELQTKGDCQLVENDQQADLVVLMESNTHKTRKHSKNLLQEPVLLNSCAKVCTINYEDSPAGFLRGAYSSLEKCKFDRNIHLSWPAIFLPNELVYATDSDQWSTRPAFLSTFVGSMSHPIRGHLVKALAHRKEHFVSEINKWYTHDAADKQSYVENIRQGLFALCPRGHASYTHRIAEVMALGRVPVVIADGWVPFSIPEKDYYIRIDEAQVENVHDILDSLQSDAGERGAHARTVWMKYFSKQRRAAAVVSALAQLVASRSVQPSIPNYRSRWNSRFFLRINGWSVTSLLLRRFRNMMHRKTSLILN